MNSRPNKNFREREFANTLAEVRRNKSIYADKKHYVEPDTDIEFCENLENEFYEDAWVKFKTYDFTDKSVLSDWLKKRFGMKKCKKSEATAIIFIGKYHSDGCYNKDVKHYWLNKLAK